MRTLLQELWQAFFAELAERLQHAQRVLATADDGVFDRLHQVFDTLYGAARAVDCVCLETCNRRLAEYARMLKRRNAPLSGGRELLLEAIDLQQHCVARGYCSSDCPSRSALTRLQGTLDQVMGGEQ